MHLSNNRLYLGLSIIILGIFVLLTNTGHIIHIGALFLGAIFIASAVLFARLFMRDDRKWWAVIPAGILFTLGTLVIIDGYHLLGAVYQWIVLFLGIAMTFAFLWTRRDAENRLHWCIYPAVVTGLIAILLYLGGIHRLDGGTFIALLIMMVGVWLLVKAIRS
ncbi:hypothetical protein JXO59_06460 [candidate division KSB1 bacterium]|nr:hypothetical protein [candidate division KSB1 bacterium]